MTNPLFRKGPWIATAIMPYLTVNKFHPLLPVESGPIQGSAAVSCLQGGGVASLKGVLGHGESTHEKVVYLRQGSLGRDGSTERPVYDFCGSKHREGCSGSALGQFPKQGAVHYA